MSWRARKPLEKRVFRAATGAHTSPVAALKTLFSRGFLALQLMQGHHRHRRNHCHPNGFHKELQVLGRESRSWHVIDTLDVLSAWSSADLHDVAWLATVEAKTTMRVSLHWVGAI